MRFTLILAFAWVIGLASAPAATVHYDIRPADGVVSPVMVAPGAMVVYEATITVDSGDNDGLNSFIIDVMTDLGIAQTTNSITFAPLTAAGFDILLQQTGTPNNDDIIDVGAVQGLGLGTETTGIGQSGVQVLFRGALQTQPGVVGTFAVTIGPATDTQLLAIGGGLILNPAVTTTVGTGFTISTEASDQDGDLVPDDTDNCPADANVDQADGDGDDFGDVCDNCPALENPGQEDCDGDAIGDACTVEPGLSVYISDGASTGAWPVQEPVAQRLSVQAPRVMGAFSVGYTATASTSVGLTVRFYETDARTTILPPAGLITEYVVPLSVTPGDGLYHRDLDASVAIPENLWVEVEFDSDSVAWTTTDKIPEIGKGTGRLYLRNSETLDRQVFILSIFAELDCNGNGVPDECDLTDGTSADCNQNAWPDECDPDADGDQVPDECDNCPANTNSDQADADLDGVGNVCDDDYDPGDDGDDNGTGNPPPGDDGSDPGDGGGASTSGLGGFGIGGAAAIGLPLIGWIVAGPWGFFIGLIVGIMLAIMSLFGLYPPPV